MTALARREPPYSVVSILPASPHSCSSRSPSLQQSQCCGSRMIYWGSDYKCLAFRIRILPILLRHIWKLYLKKSYYHKRKKNILTTGICYFLLHTTGTVLQYRIFRPRNYIEIFFKFICSFIFAGSGPNNFGSGSGSRRRSCRTTTLH